jgi:hypothetical protein
MGWFTYVVVVIVLAGITRYVLRSQRSRQLAYIQNYRFHSAIKEKVRKKYPRLDEQQLEMVFRALKDYFWMCNMAKRNMVAMPSQVVDDAWHEFILFTRAYKGFCEKALGRFLHHTPAEAMSSATSAQDGIKRAWRLACAKEHIDPRHPTDLPLIFVIDSLLKIPDGFTYVLECKDKSSPFYGEGYCAAHIGCSSGCAGDSGADKDSGASFETSDGDTGSDGGGD